MTKFDKFLGNLKNKTESMILVTLKHLDGLHNQKRHGWRYGANILMPNGIGKPSLDRAKSYLKKVMTRDLATRVTYNKKTKTGRSNLRNKIENTHMEYQRRTRTGARRAGTRVDPMYGRNLGDIDRKQSYMTIKKGTKREQLSTAVADRWSNKLPKLKNPLGGLKDSNRVNPKTGRANPRKNQEPLKDRKKDARTQLRDYRKGKFSGKKDARRPDAVPYYRTYGRFNPSPLASSVLNRPGGKGAGGPMALGGGKPRKSGPSSPRGRLGRFTKKELRNNILETLDNLFFEKTNE